MKQSDFDRAFAQTPVEIHEAIVTAFEKGEKRMKFRYKLISTVSAAAVLVVVFAVIAFAGWEIRMPKPDVMASPSKNTTRDLELNEENEIAAPSKSTARDLEVSEDIQRKLESKSMLPQKRGDEDSTYFVTPEPTPTPTPAPVEEDEEDSTYFVTPEPTPTPSPEPQEMGRQDEEALMMAQPTPTPLPATEIYGVYFTQEDAYYHANAHCGDVQNAEFCSINEAAEAGKFPCHKCCNFEIYVFGNAEGTYYHTCEHCCGMVGARIHPINDGILEEKPPCPNCIPETVYVGGSDSFYHLDEKCSLMDVGEYNTESAADDAETEIKVEESAADDAEVNAEENATKGEIVEMRGYVAVQMGKLPCHQCIELHVR